MFGVKDNNSHKDDDIQNLNKYKLKLEEMRTKLHCKYIVSISLGVVVWLVATGTANNSEFSSWVSFSGTITSIILSVIAIFMSISGESKMNSIRDKMDDAVEELDIVVKSLEKENETSVGSSKELQEAIRELDRKIAGMPDTMIQKMESKFGVSKHNQTVEDITLGWVNKNEK